jgi:glycosyltransferase involved in cell wall biosynthesis
VCNGHEVAIACSHSGNDGVVGTPDARHHMRVLVVGNGGTSVDPAGQVWVNSHTGEFLVGLAGAGREVNFLQLGASWDPNGGLSNAVLPADRVRSTVLRTNGTLARLRSLGRILLDVVRADAVYLFYPGTLSKAVARISLVLRRPIGIYLRGEMFDEHRGDRTVLTKATLIAGVAPGIASRTSHLSSCAVTIRPMLDVSVSEAFERPEHEWTNKPFMLLFVGRLEAQKGVPELLEAARILESRRVDFRLTLVGGGVLFERLTRKEADIPWHRIDLKGTIGDRTELMREYRRHHVFVLPTHHEGFPRVLYEAMLNSVTTVTTMVGGIPSVMRDRVNCLAIPVGAPHALADVLEELSQKRELCRAIAAEGMKTTSAILKDRPSHLHVVDDWLRTTKDGRRR